MDNYLYTNKISKVDSYFKTVVIQNKKRLVRGAINIEVKPLWTETVKSCN